LSAARHAASELRGDLESNTLDTHGRVVYRLHEYTLQEDLNNRTRMGEHFSNYRRFLVYDESDLVAQI